jgi:DNA-binding transcriptional regulator YhcF (GntR family)
MPVTYAGTFTVMENKEIPADVRRFVLTSIPSIPHMEALMLLRTNAPMRWTAESLAHRLYVTQQAAANVLADLLKAGMLRADEASGAFFYPDSPDELSALIDQLAAQYATNLVEVTLLIHSKLDRKAQQFANAFSLRKDS